MQRIIPLYYNGMPAGSISLSTDKTRYVFCAQCPDTFTGLMRAYAHMLESPATALCIGVMSPGGDGTLRARRIFTKNDLRMSGIEFDRLERGELKLCRSFIKSETIERWFAAPEPEKLFNDAVLQRALKGRTLLCGLDRTRVAAELRPDIPFDLAPVFCLTKPVYIGKTLYGMVGINTERMPVKPEAGNVLLEE
ncbi:MAG: hypothetical protein GX541_05315 [Clostridiales bacterium]|nr:hypothetical protein [Clostridiales bacterium]